MKKFLFSALLAFPLLAGAQSVINFDDLTLTPDSYWNGSDTSGHFMSGGATLSNVYDTSYGGFWSAGFSYSNMKDDSTAGFMNMYSAFPAEGANNSENYGLFTRGFGAPQTIDFGQLVQIKSINVANTTYTYLSMRDGDMMSKKFGTDTSALGVADGTNGKDFFYVTVFALDSVGNALDSTNIYLADFRSDNATEHFILDSWKEVQLNMIGYQLTFDFKSSDNDPVYGMNTPAFFALDDVVYDPIVVKTNELSNESISLYPNPVNESFRLSNYEGEISIYSAEGILVQTSNINNNELIQVDNLSQGVYLLNVNGKNIRFIKR